MSDIFGSRPGPMTSGAPSRSKAETDANAAKYAQDMKPYFDAQLLKDRSNIVIKLRNGSWTSGAIDSKYDRWYRKKDWTDAGVYTGDPAWFDTLHPDEPVINTTDEKAAKLAAARATLGKVEAKLGVKPATVTPKAETEVRTKIIPDDNPNLVRAGGDTAKGRGRPSSGEPWKALGISRTIYFDRKKDGP